MRPTFIVIRIAGAIAVVAAIIGQLTVSLDYWTTTGVRDVGTSVANFFSFFTIQSNVVAAVVLAIGAVLLLRDANLTDPRWYAVLRACAATYMITTGIVYNLLLRGIELPQGSTLGWSNEILHVVIPIVMLADWLFAPGRRRLGWGTIGVIVIYPLAWVVYTLIRGPFIYSDALSRQGWYPYPFLDPANFDNGFGTVAIYVIGIALLIGAVGAGVVALTRVRPRA